MISFFQILLYIQLIIFTKNAIFGSSIQLFTSHEENVSIDDDNCTVTTFAQVSYAVLNCRNIIIRNLTVPAGETLNLTLNTMTQVNFDGITKFERAETSWNGPLVYVSGIIITIIGNPGSVLDGQGQLYWGNKSVALRPRFFQIESTTSSFDNVSLLNCPSRCVQMDNSLAISLSGWNIDTSAGDPGVAANGTEASNTTGFQIASGTSTVSINNSTVKNQGNCIEVNYGVQMLFFDMVCSGGEGFAVDVGNTFGNNITNLLFYNSTVMNSSHAVKVITHTDAGRGSVFNLIFKDIFISDISGYAILTEQDYTNGAPTGTPSNAITVTSLSITNVTGTLTGDTAAPVYILCGTDSCINWRFVNLTITGSGKNANSSVCNYNPLEYNCTKTDLYNYY